MVPCSCPSSVLCLLPSLLLLFQLPPVGSQGSFRVFGAPGPIVAELGEDVTLPCFLYPVMSAENMELRWFRSHFLESVFIYRDQQEQHEEMMAQYVGRTSLVGKFLSKGKAALLIHRIQASDNGLYNCFFSNGYFHEQASLELQVAGVGSAPHVHITGPEEDGVRMVCMTSGWFPEPQVQWRHPHGVQFLEFSKIQSQDTEGLFSVEASLVVRDSSVGSVTCSILNPVLGQEKSMAIVIPEPFFPRASPWKPAFLVSLPLLLLLLLGAACYTRREHSTLMRELQEQRNLRPAKEEHLQTKVEVLKDIDELQAILDQRKAAYLAAWRKAQLYADWRKEQFRAWPVTLDPGSCYGGIVLSQDRKSLKSSKDGNKEGYSACGLEGITSGRCYWEVEVRNVHNTECALGVCREDEKTTFSIPSPLKGIWIIGWYNNIFLAFADTPLPLRQVPHRVGVFLDYDHGDISFYDMTDGSHIFSFPPESFSGTLFPYFVCYFGDVSMTLCSLEVGAQKPSVPMNNPLSLEESVCSPGEGIPSGSGVDGAPPGSEAPLLPCTSETMSP
ncbi:butyrophilin-like protein 1 isoform X2 [Talpa occidentalis]|uniref:butyrophilin-like protein 1 isoform X2 n=1 Tax=Talpa occidentalis TaxID=50954 RepID=UPI0023F9756F|nr:butyrophilin-like protein 1 isoform X2 [Talpa occidentalis]